MMVIEAACTYFAIHTMLWVSRYHRTAFSNPMPVQAHPIRTCFGRAYALFSPSPHRLSGIKVSEGYSEKGKY